VSAESKRFRVVEVSQLTSVFATTHQQHNYPKIASLFRKFTPARSPHPRGKSKGRSMGTKVKKAERFAVIRKTPKLPQIVPL
jgi:hypothetical protein